MLIEYMDPTEKDHYCRLERLLFAAKGKDALVLTAVRDKLLVTVKARIINSLSWQAVMEEVDEAAKRERKLLEWENHKKEG
jgi:hypothetical protein